MQTKFLLFLLSSLSQGAVVLRHKREADPLFGNVVRGLIGLLAGNSNNNQPATSPSHKRPPSYHAPAPSYSAPAPSYHAPAPSYRPAPQQSYRAPAPVVSHPAPAPHYDPPAPKPEIVILPAPDLSQGTYGAPAAAPSYEAPAPSYEAPETYGAPAAAPAYEAPAPSYEAPETYGAPAAAPAYEAPETYGAPAAAPTYEAPAPSYEAPETYGAPAAAPSYEAPAPSVEALGTYGAPAPLPSYEEPVSAYEAPETYGAPEALPSYESPSLPAVDAPLPSYDTYESPAPAPVYEEPIIITQAPPVYQPDNYDPAPVDLEPLAKAAPLLDVPSQEVNVVDVVDVKTSDIVDVRTDEEEQPRSPKSFSGESPVINQIQNSEIIIESFDTSSDNIVIDLTNTDQVVISSESTDPFPTEVEQPALPPAFEGPTTTPVQQEESFQEKSQFQETSSANEEVIVFKPIKDDDLEDHQNTFLVIQQDIQPSELVEETTTQLAITPIVSNQDLRNVISDEPDQDAVQIFDFSDNGQEVAELVIAEITEQTPVEIQVTEDTFAAQTLETDTVNEIIVVESDVDNEEQNLIVPVEEVIVLESEIVPVEPTSKVITVEDIPVSNNPLQEEIIESSTDDFLPETSTEVQDQTVEPITTTTKAPILRKATFQLQEQKVDNSFEPVDDITSLDTFQPQPTQQSETLEDDAGVTEVLIPEPLVNDPAFQEIAKEGEILDQKKRAFLSTYDPRQGRLYGHKYNDNTSNWYYYSRAGF